MITKKLVMITQKLVVGNKIKTISNEKKTKTSGISGPTDFRTSKVLKKRKKDKKQMIAYECDRYGCRFWKTHTVMRMPVHPVKCSSNPVALTTSIIMAAAPEPGTQSSSRSIVPTRCCRPQLMSSIFC